MNSTDKNQNHANLTYDDYVKERELLSRYEQSAIDSYEKAILTLSSAFLVFSVTFLGIVRNKTSDEPLPPLGSIDLLICSWIFFAISVFLTLLCFVANAISLRTALADIEPILDNQEPTTKAHFWNKTTYILHMLSGIAFIIGVISLIMFCVKNIQMF